MIEVTRQHVDEIRQVAHRFAPRLPAGADTEALEGVALEALAKAVGTFNGTGDFASYAAGKAWWALLDHARSESIYSRPEHEKRKRGDKIVTRHGHEVLPISFLSMQGLMPGTDSLEVAEVVAAPDDEYAETDARIDRQRMLGRLDARTRFVVLARAWGYSTDEVAEALGVTPSRVSQITATPRRLAA